jgi:hypothetical protein
MLVHFFFLVGERRSHSDLIALGILDVKPDRGRLTFTTEQSPLYPQWHPVKDIINLFPFISPIQPYFFNSGICHKFSVDP